MIHFLRSRSIFLKIILVFIATALAINLVVFGLFRFLKIDDPEETRFRSTGIFLLESILEQNGKPITETEAQQIKERYNIFINFESSGNLNSFSIINENVAELRYWLNQEHEDYLRYSHRPDPYQKIGWRRGFLLSEIKRPEGTYFISIPIARFTDTGPGLILMVLFLISLVLLGSYFIMRKILAPIRQFMNAIVRTGDGDFSYRLSNARLDEFGELAGLYNQMQSQIEQLFTRNSQLLLDVSHEIRTPLTRMKLTLALMEPTERTKAIESEIKGVDELLSGILANAKQNPLQLTITDERFDRTVHRAVEPYRLSHPAIHFEIDVFEIIIPHDSAAIVRAIQNLIENSIKHSGRPLNELRITLYLTIDIENDLTLTYKDNGNGLDPSIIDTVFDAFRKGERSEGTGLGLNLVRRVIESHPGGSITVKNKNPGLSFFIRLSYAKEKTINVSSGNK